MPDERRLLQGNEAIAEGAIRAGVRFFAGYPITPATEIAEYMARELPKVRGSFIQMEDEIASMAAIVGASLAGVRSMTASSGPGISLKQENIGMAAMQEVPCVVVNVSRVGPATGMATMPAQQDVMQAKWGAHGDRGVIALCPSSVKECFELTVQAVSLSERFRTPVYLLTDAEVGHMREVIDIPTSVNTASRVRPDVPPDEYLPYAPGEDMIPPMADFGEGYFWHAEASTHNEYGDLAATDTVSAAALNTRLINKIDSKREELALYSAYDIENADALIISYGISARSSRAAIELLREDGIRAGCLVLKTLWPIAEKTIAKLIGVTPYVFVAELNDGQYSREIERIASGRASVRHIGRYDGLILTPEDIRVPIREALL